VLTSFDDYPVHQSTGPIAETASGDPNFYDRYFFNGYRRDASVYFAVAMGLYPNRHVADAAFSVVTGGSTQVNVHASRRAPNDRRDATEIGPIRVEVLEPLRRLAVHVDSPEHGLRASLEFTARSPAIEEPHFRLQTGVRVAMDYTRLTQFGTWEGWIELDGERIVVAATDTWGSRDRSWGVRPVGERMATGAPTGAPQFYWLWAPVNFDGFATHFDVNEHADGRRWHETGFIVTDDAPAEAMRTVDYRLEWQPGTRWAEWCEIDLTGWDGRRATVRLEPLYNFQMLGIGYGHPEWSHGVWKGELAVGGDRWTLPVDDPLAPHHLHVQAVCRATYRDERGEATGLGIFEQFVIGEHQPSRLRGLFDGFAPAGSKGEDRVAQPNEEAHMGNPIDDDEVRPPSDEETVSPTPAADDPSFGIEVPQPDAADQAREVTPGSHLGHVSRGIETPEADAIDQAMEVPIDDEVE